jgi:CRISPR/Cas system-associated exonuclease Cas4 (RecB family)
VLVENKFTDGYSLSLTQAVVEKIRAESLREGCEYWAVEMWIRPHSLKVYAVCSDLIVTAQDFGLEYPEPQDLTLLPKQKSTRYKVTTYGRNPWVWVRTGWGDGDLDFYFVDKERMEELVDAVRNPEYRRYLDLSKVLYYYYGDFNNKPNTRAVGIVGGSDLGKCKLRTWYRLVGTQPQPIFTTETRMLFIIGHLLHDRIQADIAKIFGSDLFRAEVLAELPEYNFRGSADGLFDVGAYAAYQPPEWIGEPTMAWAEGILRALADGAKLLLEIKTCSRLPTNPKADHMMQAVAYGKALEATDICFLYVHKASGQMAAFVRKVDNPTVWRKVQEELQYLKEKANAVQPPPREISSRCKECEYKWVCQPPGY